MPLGTVLYLSLLAAHAGAPPAAGSAPVGDDDATIMYTSGTTGHPKGVLSSHESITAAVNSLGVTFALLDMMGAAKAAAEGTVTQPIQDCILLAVPLFHCTATHAVFLPSFLSGRKMVMM